MRQRQSILAHVKRPRKDVNGNDILDEEGQPVYYTVRDPGNNNVIIDEQDIMELPPKYMQLLGRYIRLRTQYSIINV